MDIVTKIGGGRTQHAAQFNQQTGAINLYCDSLKYPNYFASVRDHQKPAANNVTCKKCLKNISAWQKGDKSNV